MVPSPELLSAVFPWTLNLSGEETRQFMADLVDAASDPAERDVQADIHRVVTEWRSAARILADPDRAEQLTRHLPYEDLDEEHGEVTVPRRKGVEGIE